MKQYMGFHVLDDINITPWSGMKDIASRIPSLPPKECFEESSRNK